MILNLGLVLALACAALTQLGFLFKHRGANHVPLVEWRSPLRSVRALFTTKWFLIGVGVGAGAWALHVAALALAPLSVVQAVLSPAVVMLAGLGSRVFVCRVSRRPRAGAAMTAAGLPPPRGTLPQ